MSLSWANKLAKNALLTAQKAQNIVDSVLDIKEDENDDEVEEETSAVEHTDEIDEQDDETPTTSQYQTDGNEGEKFTDVDLSVNTTHLGDWTVEPSSNDQVVVDSEPNPIRDAHDPDTSMCHHYSPSSHSPDEEEHNGVQSSAASAELDLSLINMDSSEFEMPPSMHDLKQDISTEHRDDAVTIASSDIEVIKHVDSWSLASSSHRRTASDQVQGVVPGAKESTGAELLSRLDHIDQNVAEKIAVLEAQIAQRDRRLEELNRANQNLKTSNSNLLAKNKQIAAKANNEAKLQKKIVEKDKELAELMEEGQRLSEHSGKQSKEIRRLKEQLKQLDVVTAARDSALEELKGSQDTIEHLTEEVSDLKTQVKAAEQEKETLREEYNLTQASTDLVQKHVAEREAEYNLAKAEIDRLSDELQSALRAKDELTKEVDSLSMELMSKKAQDCYEGERERGIAQDLADERSRNATLSSQVKQLEQKLEAAMDNQREIASSVAESNAPLLKTITQLQERSSELEAECSDLRQRLTEHNLKSQNMTSTFEQLREQKELVESRLSEQELRITSMINEMHQLVREKEATSKELRQVRKDLEEKSHAQVEHETAEKQRQKELSELQKRVNNLNEEIERLRRQYTVLKDEHAQCALKQRVSPVEALSNVRESPVRRETTPTLHANMNDSMHEDGPVFLDMNLYPSNSGAQDTVNLLRRELAMLKAKNEQLMDMVHGYENRNSEFDALSQEVRDLMANEAQMRTENEQLLQMYGEALEKIEELQEDIDDLRKLCHMQAMQLTAQQAASGDA